MNFVGEKGCATEASIYNHLESVNPILFDRDHCQTVLKYIKINFKHKNIRVLTFLTFQKIT